jgi:hypothetical protein
MKRENLFLFLLFLGKVFLSGAGASYNQDPPDYMEFLPVLYYEEDDERHKEFSVKYDFAGGNVENNRENYCVENGIGIRTGNQSPGVYIHGGKGNGYVVKLLDKDKDGDPFWVIEYHFYSPRNTYYLYQTHEHDWEWIYVVIIEDENGYTPLLASSSSHDTTGSNSETFRSRKYGRYSDDYLKFTQDGRFGLLEIASGKRAIFYVGNDGNAMYGRKNNLREIERWRNKRPPFVLFEIIPFEVIPGRDSIEETNVSVSDFSYIIPVLSEGLSPNIFYGGDEANLNVVGLGFPTGETEGTLTTPWIREPHWLDPFPSKGTGSINVPDTIPPVVKKVTIIQNSEIKYCGTWTETTETIGSNNVTVVVSRTWDESSKRLCNSESPV